MPKVIPFGDRILVKREKVGETLGKEGLIVAAETTSERLTDLAVVKYIPEHSFADQQLISKSSDIISSLLVEAEGGNSDALIAVLRYNSFLKIKSIQQGDKVMISKYVGTDFHESGEVDTLTMVKDSDIIGLVVDDE